MSEWHRFTGSAELDRELAQNIAQQLARDIGDYGQASLAVSGGGTPKHMFQQLSRCELDWSKVWITLVDERWVAPDSPHSNERLVRENLLRDRAAKARLVSLKCAQDNAEDGLVEVQQRLAQVPRPFSIVVLGMGGDGHTASWFPRAENVTHLLDPAATAELAATNPVTAPHQRITLTLSAVLNSRDIIIHITGQQKKAVLESAIQNDYPVGAILKQHTSPVSIWWAP